MNRISSLILFFFISFNALILAQSSQFKTDTIRYESKSIKGVGHTINGHKFGFWEYWYENGVEWKQLIYKIDTDKRLPYYNSIFINYDSIFNKYEINPNVVSYEATLDTIMDSLGQKSYGIQAIEVPIIEYFPSGKIKAKIFFNSMNDNYVILKTYSENGSLLYEDKIKNGTYLK